jgi:hypothetical protein
MNAIAYHLVHDYDHLEGTDDDAILVPFEGQDQVCGWVGTRVCQVPNPVVFEANFKVTRQSDYPCNDVNWPIMSPRMLEILRSVGDFPHRLVPVRLVDRSVQGLARYLVDGTIRPELVDDRFAAVQIIEHIDVVDWERSVFDRDEIGPGILFYSFDKLVLRGGGELPPLFRISSSNGMLLVSAEARSALEAAGIRGVSFKRLRGA